MHLLRVVIVDDEPIAVRRLERLLRDVAGVAVAGTATNAQEAKALVARHDPDLMLLDIEMPGMNGVELAKQLSASGQSPSIVFVTAYSRFAVEAFDRAAVDYLLKPVDRDRLAEAVERVRTASEARESLSRIVELEQLVERHRVLEQSTAAAGRDLWLQSRGGRERVRVSDIMWIEAERDYVRVHTASRSFFIRGRLGELERRLSACGMMRVHRSALVRASAISRVEDNGARGYRLTLESGQVVAASRRLGARIRHLAAELNVE